MYPQVSMAMFGLHLEFFLQKDECMYEVVNKIYLRNFFMDVFNFRDESNESSFTMIGYSDGTVIIHNHPRITRSKVLLITAHATLQYHNYRDCFIIKFHLISLISSQRAKSFHKFFFTL